MSLPATVPSPNSRRRSRRRWRDDEEPAFPHRADFGTLPATEAVHHRNRDGGPVMTAATKTVSALPASANMSLDALTGPAMAAMMLPSTMMLGGIVTMCGFGFAFARAFEVIGRDQGAPAPAAAAPRLVVSNPPPVALTAVEAAKPAPAKPPAASSKPKAMKAVPTKVVPAKVVAAKVVRANEPALQAAAVTLPATKVSAPAATVEAAKPVPAKPSAAPPKPTRPGGSPPKPKAMKVVSPKDAPAAPKAAAVKTAVPEVPAVAPVEAAKPVSAKPTGIPPKPSRPGGSPPKPKMAMPSTAEPPVAAAPAKKVVPKAPKALTIATTSTSKGISLPKLSIQKNPGSEPGKD
ncbi:hypothetical protein [Phreatobacter sp.]|uniref:hypothetical protein n=1 Tax=Phreatobacter sp. TaxID=1966341 RepID=UPI002733E695|nr:hypothetical protein [Phreatobacter sp.]